MVSAVLAVLIFVFALIKNLSDDYSTFWSYLGVVLAALIAVGAWLQVQEAGGMDTLKTEASTMRESGTSASAPTSPPPAEPTAPATPPSAPTQAAPPATPPPTETPPPSSEQAS